MARVPWLDEWRRQGSPYDPAKIIDIMKKFMTEREAADLLDTWMDGNPAPTGGATGPTGGATGPTGGATGGGSNSNTLISVFLKAVEDHDDAAIKAAWDQMPDWLQATLLAQLKGKTTKTITTNQDRILDIYNALIKDLRKQVTTDEARAKVKAAYGEIIVGYPLEIRMVSNDGRLTWIERLRLLIDNTPILEKKPKDDGWQDRALASLSNPDSLKRINEDDFK